MTDISTLTIAVDATQTDKAAKSLDNLTASAASAEKATEQFGRSNQNAWASLNTISAAEDAAADKAWALANGYKEVGGILVKANADIENSANGAAHANAGMTRELMVLGHEAVSGNFSRIPGSMMVLAQRSGFALSSLAGISPVVLGIGAAAAVGAVAWYEFGKAAEEAAKQASEAAKSADKDAKAAWSHVQLSTAEQITQLQNKIDGATGLLDAAIEKRNAITQQTSQKIAMAIGAEVLARRQEIEGYQRQIDQLQAKSAEVPKVLVDKNATAVLQMQNEEYKKQWEVLGQTSEQIKVYQLEMNGATAAQIKAAQAAADGIAIANQELAAQKAHTEAEKEWQQILGNTDPAAKAAQEWQHLLDLQKELKLSDDDIVKAYNAMQAKSDTTAKEMNHQWKTFVDNTQRTLSDVFMKAFQGDFNSIGDMFLQLLMRMAADAAAFKMTQAMFGVGGLFTGSSAGVTYGSGNDGQGYATNAAGETLSFAGGGYTGDASRSGGIDGMGGFMAVLHPQESVIDHTRQGSSGGASIHYAPVIQIDARTDKAQIESLVAKSIAQGHAQLVDRLQRMRMI